MQQRSLDKEDQSPMNKPTHPSDEKFCAYFDGELSEAERTEFESQIADDPQAQALLQDFTQLNELGSVVSDQMPGDSYWQDLPDRVLARIAAEGMSERTPVVSPSRGSWWQRLLAPQSAWRWAAATAVIAVVGAGMTLQNRESSDTPTDLAAVDPSATDIAATITQSEAQTQAVSKAYVRRVAHTLGGSGNLGEPLDQDSQLVGREATTDGTIRQVVDFGNLDVPKTKSPRTLLAGSTSNLEDAFMAARYCEEQGAPDMAGDGYRLVSDNTPHESSLHLAAEIGIVRSQWRSLMEEEEQIQDTLNQLSVRADEMYREHHGGDHTICEDAWAIHFTLVDLGRPHLEQAQHSIAVARMNEIATCVE